MKKYTDFESDVKVIAFLNSVIYSKRLKPTDIAVSFPLTTSLCYIPSFRQFFN